MIKRIIVPFQGIYVLLDIKKAACGSACVQTSETRKREKSMPAQRAKVLGKNK